MPVSDSQLSANDLILRDTLAIERTELANERTFFAAIRTGLTFFIAGVTVIKFFDQHLVIFIGWCFLVISIILMFFSFFKRIAISKNIHASYYFSPKEVQASFQKNSFFTIKIKSSQKNSN